MLIPDTINYVGAEFHSAQGLNGIQTYNRLTSKGYPRLIWCNPFYFPMYLITIP